MKALKRRREIYLLNPRAEIQESVESLGQYDSIPVTSRRTLNKAQENVSLLHGS